MAYRIAVASSDGVNIDLSFGAASEFLIYEADGTEYRLFETRRYEPTDSDDAKKSESDSGADQGCGDGAGCGGGHGCGAGGGGHEEKVSLLSDIRCLICKKIGFGAQKALERKGITSFDIECGIDEALEKITAYIDKMDNHISLRGIQRK